ncbi:MAG: hypothetical protein ABJO65_00300 [Hyphomicrobiales bacterium]
MTVVTGTRSAVVFVEPIVHFFDLDPSYTTAVAAILVMTGRNWAAFAIRVIMI